MKATTKPMTFRINGGTAAPSLRLPPVTQKILRACQELPDGELVDGHRIAALADVSLSALRNSLGYAEMAPHKTKWIGQPSNANLYGNAKTIEAYQAAHR